MSSFPFARTTLSIYEQEVADIWVTLFTCPLPFYYPVTNSDLPMSCKICFPLGVLKFATLKSRT